MFAARRKHFGHKCQDEDRQRQSLSSINTNHRYTGKSEKEMLHSVASSHDSPTTLEAVSDRGTKRPPRLLRLRWRLREKAHSLARRASMAAGQEFDARTTHQSCPLDKRLPRLATTVNYVAATTSSIHARGAGSLKSRRRCVAPRCKPPSRTLRQKHQGTERSYTTSQ